MKSYELKSSLKKKGDRTFFHWQAEYETWKKKQEDLFEKFHQADLHFEIFRKKKPSKPAKTYFNLSNQKSKDTLLSVDGKLIDLETIIGILNPKTGEFSLGLDLVDDYLSSDGHQVKDANIYDLVEMVKRTGKSSHFTYLKGKERWLGTLYPSKVIPGKIYLFTQNEAFLIQEILVITYVVTGFIILALLSTLILGVLMSKRIITPVAELTKKISRLADLKLDEKVEIKQKNELGKLAYHFNEMADSIQEKLFYMKAVDDINRLMNSNHSRMIMLKYILHLLSVKYRAGLGLIGFFHKALSVRAHEYSIYESAIIEQKEQEALVEKVLAFVQDHQSFFQDQKIMVLNEEQLAYFHPDLKNGIMYYLGDEGDADSIPVAGVLFLSDISDVLNKNKDMSVVLHMVESLCEQAKTIVMKSLLDEIGGDTEKGWEVQKSLMPNYDPDGLNCLDIASYFEGAIGLAGDYFDYLEFEEKSLLGFSIADVSGKGIGPSLFGATSRAFMKVLAQKYICNTAQTLIDLNDNISYDKSSTLFLTMFYCVIDLKSMTMFYSSAGHNKMFLLKKSGELVYLSAKGLVIGMFTPVVYEQKSIAIEPGDEVILYTDGVTEHENPHLDLYGDDKFEDFCKEHQGVPSKEWSQILAKDLEDFRAGIFPSDDITYIRIKILKRLEEESV
ncbi:SpoIIE family protein phosphatase [bacterium]|nr:SpoIIE family protein phosphatase [bacterium]